MKKKNKILIYPLSLLTVLLILLFEVSTDAQNYNISFAATGGAVTKLDSVKVENLNQITKLSLPGEDTLHLSMLGIDDGANPGTIKVYPNPMQGLAELSFYAKASGYVLLSIYDINGKVIAQTNTLLEKGTHNFQIKDLNQGMYVINIIGNSYSYTTKVISDYFTTNEAELTYLGIEKLKTGQTISKTTNVKFDMAYTTGDELLFTGYSGNYISQKTDAPTSSKTIMFAFTGNKSTPVWSCGDSLKIKHVAGSVAPVNEIVTYGTVTNIPGEPSKCWITQNLGASHQADSVSDSAEAAAGWYWQFNLQQGYMNNGHQNTPNTTWITSISDSSNWTAENDPCTLLLGIGWRIPTSTEWENVSGYWDNWMGAWNSNLKLHAAGYLDYQNGLLASREKIGRYWSSSQVNNTLGSSLYFDANSCYIDNSSNKAFGFPLRCLMDTCTITTANAGQGQTVCGDSTTLAGNNPSPDNGLWTILSGSGGYFGNANAYNSSFTGTAGIDYSLLWTITNPPCSDSSSSEVKISFVALPTTANAGPNQSVCGDSTTLAGNYPKIGTGTWTIVDGNIGYFGNANAYNSSFTGTAGIDYSLRWTISNPPCPDSYSDVKIDLVAPPTVANAGPDQSVCGDFTILAGNNPKVGTGQWTIIIGLGGTLGDSSAYNSLFKGRLGTIYTLRWTISNPPCPDSYSDVRVEFSSGLMHLVNAGPNQDVCGNSTTLAANNPNPGYGYWTIVSGTGGHFGNDSAYNSSFSGYEDSTYILRWTVYTPPCPPSYADVRIKFFVPPTIANAGPNQTVCDTSTTLDGNSPIHGTGLWTIVSGSGGHIVNPSLYNSEFYGDTGRTYILHWTISTDSCPPSMDSVTIKFASAPYSYAGPTQTICGDSTTLAGNNPSPGTGKWKVISGSGGILGNDTIYNTAFSGTRGTTYTLTWTVTDINCHRPSTDTVSITFDTPPTTANAGPDQFVHGTTTTLAGNNPYPYSGLWTVLSHSGGTFGNDTAHHSSFTGTAGTIDTLRWTISNGACVSYDDVVISFWGCGDTLIIHHVAGNVAPVTETVTYGTATITKGGSTKCWITQNLGAIHQALSISDTSLAAAGWYWQFDYTQGYTGENYNIIPHSTFACSDTSTTNWKPGNDPCTLLLGSGWRIPDSTEWANEIQGWSNKNDTSGWNSVLKLHPAGGIACEGPDSGLISGRGISGWYWSSTQITGGPTGGNILQFGSTACYMYTSPKPLGNTLRCLKDK